MKRNSWSFTGLKDFESCERKYEMVRYRKLFPFEESPEVILGNRYHKAAEDYLLKGTPIPKDLIDIKPSVDYVKSFSKSGKIYGELKMAFDYDGKDVPYFDKSAWCRVISDVTIIEDNCAYVFDYKSGKSGFVTEDQLLVNALGTLFKFQNVNSVECKFLFFKESRPKDVHVKVWRDDIPGIFNEYKKRMNALDLAVENNVFKPTMTKLCDYCPVSVCEFHPNLNSIKL